MASLIYLVGFLSAFSGIAQALPSPAVTVTVVPVPAAASPYPGTPTTNEFKYENWDENSDVDKADRKTIHDAFVPWASVIQKARESLLDTNDDTYDRWFPQNVKNADPKQPSRDGRAYVSGMFGQMHKYDTSNPTPQSIMTSMVADQKDVDNSCKANTNAYTIIDTGRFHVCKPKGLSQTTAATDIKCDDLGSFVSSKMQSLTGTLIHEPLHWKRISKDYPNTKGRITDIQYGPTSCSRLRDGPSSQDTFINADSYKWFALNAYYNSVCNKKFGDPVITEEEFEMDQAELKDSPLYDPALSDGVLAGV